MKTAIVTGASRGIGLATAKKFLKEGWTVVGTYVDSPVPIEHEEFSAVKYDQGDSQSIARAATEILRLAPQIHALVNNAGILIDPLDKVADPVKVRKTLEVDVVGVIDLTERLLPNMTVGTHIVNLDSGYGSFAEPIDDETSAGYRIAKAALNMYTRHLAFRVKDRGIIVSSIAPGWVNTRMGNEIADATEKPDRQPEEAAKDIFELVDGVTETGCFWEYGEKHAW